MEGHLEHPKCSQSHKLHDSLNNTRFANLTQMNDINANLYTKYKHLHHIMYVVTNVGLGYMLNSGINLSINMNMKILNQLSPIYCKIYNWNCVFVVCKKSFFQIIPYLTSSMIASTFIRIHMHFSHNILALILVFGV
jgi:hypothetical protein